MTARYYPLPAALAGVSFARHGILEASAGTGKTYSIEHLVLALLLKTPAKLENILVVTFTEKATAELRGRIRAKLDEALAATLDAPPAGAPYVTIDARAVEKLERALSSFDAAPIFTIHGFCKRVLADQAFFSGQLFEQELVDERSTFERVFRAVLRSDCTEERDPARARLLRLVLQERGVDALEDLVFKTYRKRAAFTPAFDEAAWHAAAKDRDDAGALALLAEGGLTLASAAVQSLRAVLLARMEREKAAQGRMDYDDMLVRLHANLLGDGGPAFAATLRAQYAFALIDEFQDTDPLQWEIFRRIFAEPAPDDDGRPPSDVRRPLFLIGDPKQAIYAFRGADVHTYLAARDELRAGGADEAPLSENFRSTVEMVDAYNALLATRLDDDEPDPFFTGGITYDPMVRRGEPAPVVQGGGGRPALVVLHDLATDVEKTRVDDVRRRLAQQIAHEIRNLTSGNDPLTITDKGVTKTVGAGDMFVLTRTNDESILVARQLRRAGVPYAFYKQTGLFGTLEAADIRDALAGVAEPADAALRLRAWASPFFGLAWGDLAAYRDAPGDTPAFATLLQWHALAREERYHELFERMLNDSGLVRREIFFGASERARTNYEHIFEVLLARAAEKRCGVGELVRMLSRWIAGHDTPGGEDGDVQRLETEKDAVQIMTIHRSKGLEAAVVFVLGGFGTSPNKGEIAIYHDAGDPVRRIYVGKADAGPLAASAFARLAAENDEEYQRLYYVAMTRAKARLYLPLVGAAMKVEGPYACINDRLRKLAACGAGCGAGARRIEVPFTWRAGGQTEPRTAVFEIAAYAEVPSLRAPAADPARGVWSPPAALLAPPRPPRPADAVKAEVGRLRVDSFTSLRGAHARRDEPQGGEDETHGEPLALPATELPPGTATGIFLHQALEEVDPASFAGTADAPAWLAAHPGQRDRLARLCDAYAVAPEKRDHAFALVHRAFTTPLALGGGVLAGMHAAEQLARETDFVVPFPEAAHPPLGAWGGRVEARAGYLKGYIDVLFVHQGKIYFADWKSNLLDDYAPANVSRYVERAYGLQGILYSLALVRLFGFDEAQYEARFGGYAYLFLRGLDARGNGLYVNRASWAELQAFNRELAGKAPPSAFTAPPRPHTGGIGA